jgi:RimJ/RimL family protein N-acetyltransferase
MHVTSTMAVGDNRVSDVQLAWDGDSLWASYIVRLDQGGTYDYLLQALVCSTSATACTDASGWSKLDLDTVMSGSTDADATLMTGISAAAGSVWVVANDMSARLWLASCEYDDATGSNCRAGTGWDSGLFSGFSPTRSGPNFHFARAGTDRSRIFLAYQDNWTARLSIINCRRGPAHSCRTSGQWELWPYDDLESTSTAQGVPPKGREYVAEWIDDLTGRGLNLVCVREGQIAGHVAAVPADPAAPELSVFVHHDYQNRGLGTELVKHTVAYAADRDYDALTLSVSRGNHRAIHVYKNVGFEFEGDQFTNGDLDLEMRLPLSAPIADQVRLPPVER